MIVQLCISKGLFSNQHHVLTLYYIHIIIFQFLSGGNIPQNASRESSSVYGRVYEASPTGDRDITLQGQHALHAHPLTQRQVHG